MSKIADTIIQEILKSGKKTFKSDEIVELINEIQSDHRIICSGNLTLNTNGNLLTIGNKIPIRIANIDFNLLVYLIDREGELIKRETILRDVWSGVVVGGKVVDIAIYRLRELIGKDRIITQYKLGYRYGK